MSELNFLKKEYLIEVIEVDTSDLSLDLAEGLEEEAANKERLMREQLSFLESMGDIILSYERNAILVEIVSEYAEKISNKVHHVATSYANSVARLLNACKCLMELEEMLA
jgi:hypothetical protein